jgi:MFS family permease
MTRRSPLAVVFFTVFLDLLGFGIVLPLAAYYVEALGGNPRLTAWLGTAYSLAQFVFAPFWGRLSDRVGRRPIILMSVTGSFLSWALFSFAASAPSARLLGLSGSLALLMASRALAGVMAANISTAQAYVADVMTPENRTRGMGLIGAAFGLGFVFGPAIGGVLSHGEGHPSLAVPLLAAALSLLNLVLAFRFLPESLTPEAAREAGQRQSRWQQLQDALSNPRVGLPIGMFFLSTLAFAAMEWTLTSFLKHRYDFKPRDAGELFAGLGILIAFVQGGLMRRIAKGGREPQLLVVGTLLMVPGLALLPVARTVPELSWVLIVLALGQGITSPSVSGLISRSTGAAEQGATLGLSQSMSSLARAVGPFAAGWLIEAQGLAAPFLAAGAVMGLAFLMSLWVMGSTRK